MTNSKPALDALLRDQELIQSLSGILRGVEKEGLRINDDNTVSQTSHPASIGSTLTHPSITTDYSEALLEFITPTLSSADQTIDYLADLHAYTLKNIGDELIWPSSMPCRLNGDASIPIAQYGSSNVGRMKHVYRQGLGVRYGRVMQSIAGIHYNFSLSDDFWRNYQQQCNNASSSLKDFKSELYFSLIRNFRRYSWILYYLFGASPVLDRSFLGDKPHNLDQFQPNSFGLPYATSLRMSDLGYQNSAQEDLHVSYNSLHDYVTTLAEAVCVPYAEYQKIGIKRDGEYIQLNSNVLQLENEYYSDIRPKRVTRPAEKPITALKDRGVEYIEVRVLDINPFLAEGLDTTQIHFLDAFLLFCLLSECSGISTTHCPDVRANQTNSILRGRDPDLEIMCGGELKPFVEAAESLLDGVNNTAIMLDQANQTDCYTQAVAAQREKVFDVSLTPSAKILDRIKQGDEFLDLMSDLAAQHKVEFSQRHSVTLDDAKMQSLAKQSLQQQLDLEQKDTISFDDYLDAYNKQCSQCD